MDALPFMPSTHTLTEAEKKACIEMSDLFLDGELTEQDIYYTARNLHNLHLSIDQLEDLLRNDLLPVLNQTCYLS
ncbi:hypothetical protein F5884DRAFT_509477 [Xylogone sp. PMI_703]|nr:hypothetical protein F5884DRAFT_509477 [Xylogone sp. PMI_703]